MERSLVGKCKENVCLCYQVNQQQRADNKLLIKDPLAYINSSNTKNLQNTSYFFFLLHFISFQRHDFLQLCIPVFCVVFFLHFIQLNSQLDLAKTTIKIQFFISFLLFLFLTETNTKQRVLLLWLYNKYNKIYFLVRQWNFTFFLCHRTGNKKKTLHNV